MVRAELADGLGAVGAGGIRRDAEFNRRDAGSTPPRVRRKRNRPRLLAACGGGFRMRPDYFTSERQNWSRRLRPFSMLAMLVA
jgi:hypothetical protein